jgi:hypothetical protein
MSTIAGWADGLLIEIISPSSEETSPLNATATHNHFVAGLVKVVSKKSKAYILEALYLEEICRSENSWDIVASYLLYRFKGHVFNNDCKVQSINLLDHSTMMFN